MKTMYAALLMSSLLISSLSVAGDAAAPAAQPTVTATSQVATPVPCNDKAPGAKPCVKPVTTAPAATPAK